MLTVHKLTAGDFPSFLEGLSLRRRYPLLPVHLDSRFPFLFGRAFIEAREHLRHDRVPLRFPFLFGRAFIEAHQTHWVQEVWQIFPFLLEGVSLRPVASAEFVDGHHRFPCFFVGTFIEALSPHPPRQPPQDFPSFLDGLSLRLGNRHCHR